MIGETLNHYEIIEPLGAGGVGEAYRGEDTRLGRDHKVWRQNESDRVLVR